MRAKLSLYIGFYGTGALNITDGGKINTGSFSSGHIGYRSGSEDTVTVNGAGSEWNCTRDLYIGKDGIGTMYIAGGGKVTTGNGKDVIINNYSSLLSIIVSNDSMLSVGGDFYNAGTVRLTAAPDLAAGTYTPISVSGDWTLSDYCITYGGLWSITTRSQRTIAAYGAMTGPTGRNSSPTTCFCPTVGPALRLTASAATR